LLSERLSPDSSPWATLTTTRTHDRLAGVDDFMKKLYDVYTAVKASPGGFTHEYSLGLFRSDYMVHQPNLLEQEELHQVEFNTIASSFGGLATRVSELHRHLIKSGAYPRHPQLSLENVPRNPAAEELAAGLATAHAYYGKGRDGEKAVLFLVQAEERNVFDQRWLEYELLERHDVRSHRISLPEVLEKTRVDGKERTLLYAAPYGEVEITTVYFRAGYGPDDYPTQQEWDARLLLEKSRAIKCPTIATQLAGAKKVQQVLAMPEVLGRFVKGLARLEKIKRTFAAMYPLDSSEQGLKARKLAFEEPNRYVLKPQREGGGNNVYREKIPPFLKSLGEEKWSGYILMELIEPPPAEGVIVRNGDVLTGGVVGELGVYGMCLWKGNGEIVENRQCGWLLRTKGKESEEGGVAAGYGCVDGVCLN
jgi:glutathione synthetase